MRSVRFLENQYPTFSSGSAQPYLRCLESKTLVSRTRSLQCTIVRYVDGRAETLLVAFFNSFRKGPVVCRGLDLDLSGKVVKKTTLTRKRGRHAHNVFLLGDKL